MEWDGRGTRIGGFRVRAGGHCKHFKSGLILTLIFVVGSMVFTMVGLCTAAS